MKNALLACFFATAALYALDGLAVLRDIPDNTWVQLAVQGDSTAPGQGHCNITVDCDSQRVFLYGSDTHGSNYNETWYFNLRDFTWHQLYPQDPTTVFRKVTSPVLPADKYWPVCSTATGVHPMASHTFDGMRYVPGKSAVLMFENCPHNGNPVTVLGAGAVGTSWILDTKTLQWKLLTNAISPEPGIIGKIGVMPDGSRTIGCADGTYEFNWADSTWVLLTTTGPGPTTYHNAIEYDTYQGKFVVYGGSGAFDRNSFDPATRTWALMDSSAIGPSMNGTNIGYDTLNKVLVAMAVEEAQYGFSNPSGRSVTWVRGADGVWRPVKSTAAGDTLPPHYGFSFKCDYDLANNVTYFMTGNQLWAYRFKSKATVDKEKGLASVTLVPDDAQVEQYLWTNLRIAQTYASAPADTTPLFLGSVLASLTPAKVSVTNLGLVRALDTGTALIALEKNGLRDTLVLPIVASTAVTDSILITPDSIGILAQDSFSLASTGYFHSGAKAFTRKLDSVAAWASADNNTITVENGKIRGIAAGGPLAITATYTGVTGTAYVAIWPRPSFIKRINFSPSAAFWRFGWLADAGAAYDSARGYGWIRGAGASRDDRNGPNYLLKSFVIGDAGAQYKIRVPDGSYIIKTGMGDNVYGTASRNWLVYNTDTVNLKDSGVANGINVDTVEATGGNGVVLEVSGPFNYIVIISNEGIDVNTVADDGGLLDNESRGGTAAAKKDQDAELQVFTAPNPFNPLVTVLIKGRFSGTAEINLYNVRGRRILAKTLYQENSFVWDAAGAASGIYLVNVKAGGKQLVRKLVLQR